MGYAAVAGWPLRRVVEVHPTNRPGERFDADETLECGHRISPPGWVYKTAKRRRCEDCAIAARGGRASPNGGQDG